MRATALSSRATIAVSMRAGSRTVVSRPLGSRTSCRARGAAWPSVSMDDVPFRRKLSAFATPLDPAPRPDRRSRRAGSPRRAAAASAEHRVLRARTRAVAVAVAIDARARTGRARRPAARQPKRAIAGDRVAAAAESAGCALPVLNCSRADLQRLAVREAPAEEAAVQVRVRGRRCRCRRACTASCSRTRPACACARAPRRRRARCAPPRAARAARRSARATPAARAVDRVELDAVDGRRGRRRKSPW